MNFAEILNVIYDYRHSPDPAAVPLILSWTSKEKILQDPDTAIGWTGVITALWDRHPEKRGLWRSLHPKVIHKAHRIAFDRKNMRELRYADFLLYRWVILAKDQEAWALLLRAHHPDKQLAQGAQSCIERIMFGTQMLNGDGRPITDVKGEVLGHIQFPDLREQMVELAKEFAKMKPNQRNLPFDILPFSQEFRMKRDYNSRGFVGLVN